MSAIPFPASGDLDPDQLEREAAGELDWPDPQPLVAKVPPEPYPTDALPGRLRLAVEEVHAFVQAPFALVASSALSALSVAAQAHMDAKRADKLHGPVSLNLLSIADSGERKTTCDNFFTAPIREHEKREAERMEPEVKRHEANLAAWTAKQEGIKAAIRKAASGGNSTAEEEEALERLELSKPEPPKVPRILLGDETPENLAWSLAKIWPSAGVVSSEAGLVLGAHGMGKESIMRSLALLNILWDGVPHSFGRKTSQSFTLEDVRLTVGLQVQEATLRSFFDASNGLARGTGFLARFLVAWPESTQGKRFFSEAPDTWPRLTAFNERITEILRRPAPLNDEGGLAPTMTGLSPDAKAAWIRFHDSIEESLCNGGELYDVRDVASKTADNAVRMAALFHFFEHGDGPIGADAFEGASRVAAWHLSEARRFFGELSLPDELADAVRLDSWLIEHCDRERTHIVGKSHAMQCGPLRKKKRLDDALSMLAELDRIRIVKEGRKNILLVNPALLSDAIEGGKTP